MDEASSGSESDHARAELEREARLRRDRFWKTGYVDGLEQGKEQALQEGFDQGYAEGAAAGHDLGLALGAATAVGAAAERFAAAGVVDAAGAEALRQLARRLAKARDRVVGSSGGAPDVAALREAAAEAHRELELLGLPLERRHAEAEAADGGRSGAAAADE